MRVALVATEKLPVPALRGGAIQLYIQEVLPYLSRSHRISVLGIEDKELPAYVTEGGVKFFRLPARSTEAYRQAVTEALGREKPEVIHVFNRPAWILPVRAASPASALVLSVHNDMFNREKIAPEIAHQCVDALGRIIAVSNHTAAKVALQVPAARAKLTTVYSGVNLKDYVPVWKSAALSLRRSVCKQWGIAQRAPVVLHVSRLSPKKGTHVVLEAMETVWEKVPAAVLLVVGSKWYGSNKADEYVRLLHKRAAEASGRVIFTGFVPPAGVSRYYASGDVFVCASQWEEPLARVHYEAMAAGLPIVTTDRGGNSEVIRGFGNGFLLEEYDNPEAMGQLILYLLQNPEQARRMGRRGRQLAEERFSWERVAGDLLKIYHQAARARD
ncbi:MAG: glycosyltransferase family 1 protein [Clostridia bacterium]|nr:MAG: glycosyltransferase family 1 protein [Clostridia bacterium]